MAEKKNFLVRNLQNFPSEIGLNPMLVYYDDIIRRSWCKETSAKPDMWGTSTLATGQCAVTALLVQDLIGGQILKCTIPAFGSHYWNQFWSAGGIVEIDLTREQFPDGLNFEPNDTVPRDTILTSPRAKQFKTSQRYRLLRDRFLKQFCLDVRARESGSWLEDFLK